MENKIYRYRPLSEFLFKELYYQEIYFASYYELNDPLDLSARIDFFSKDKNEVEYLLYFIVKSQYYFEVEERKLINNKWIELYNNHDKKSYLIDSILSRLELLSESKKNIWVSDIIILFEELFSSQNINFNSFSFRRKIDGLTNKFLKNSYVSCFSETNNNILMWSHYASKHSGICLEFRSDYVLSFPYEKTQKRTLDIEKYKQKFSEWDCKRFIFWDKITKVSYCEEVPYINFYEFAPVFENEYDCDLIGLSKSWTHKYAIKLQSLFSTKTKYWEYENEWRTIEINFDDQKYPEERIRHYPIEALSGVYFGLNTPEHIKQRIYKIFYLKNKEIEFFESKLNEANLLEFTYWIPLDD
ncbi:DUF2971 domain-containing protein [Elizabethkingia meningoseptica]|uniref:DUF2971 domain-containing protein n=1 Tax=Elizabethkingia meningoseptica TaxID=238 RepID=UPI0022F15CA7|nr:DUF2971 domain-containing protein [Elizabethkingia meningoseptica]EJK5328687.1 DUF2971 domain-containing protein [Elizabethkingia meningoseptica]MDE5468466.1 DUF2971 domain-containing protein [Elizabethkingia meningoseptica]MDE5475481.1 DUF2971 domain-containing protein [Elizabethkingia meningoseptica]MDE5479357.1 DUF2971 domain-containing protein [Elizabethkingia meningoseptica]MDE5485666.1 DUF2971 domain-containing protein [Elizabethkingia meningoseptica]